MRDNESTLTFDHLGLVVADLAAAREHLSATLGIVQWSEIFDDPQIGVSVQFGSGGVSPRFELITSLGEKSPVSRALSQGKNVLNHVAYLTHDLAAAAEALREQGCFPAGKAQPAVAYGGKPIQFFFSPLRFIIELIEAPGHRHLFEDCGSSSHSG
ncbi:MAG: VOC family protein [Acidobacteria bacterium]|nr:VOC family protein [Acidobacteriota bacterium]